MSVQDSVRSEVVRLTLWERIRLLFNPRLTVAYRLTQVTENGVDIVGCTVTAAIGNDPIDWTGRGVVSGNLVIRTTQRITDTIG